MSYDNFNDNNNIYSSENTYDNPSTGNGEYYGTYNYQNAAPDLTKAGFEENVVA